MLYDDVDVSVVDSKDFFGVAKTTDPLRSLTTSASDEIEHSSSASNSRSSSRKSSSKWELWTMEPQKIPAKQSKRTKGGGGGGGASSSSIEHDIFGMSGGTGSSSGGGSGANDSVSGESKQPEKRYELSLDFREKVAVSFQEKLSVLEERDRYIRENAAKNNKNMDVIVVGTCPDMCPEKERLLREINCSFSSFEAHIVRNEMLVVPEWLVKEYARSSADQDEPLPHELRPEPVLVDTMSHILANIVPRIEDATTAATTTASAAAAGNVDAGEWYHFCWDRLRSLRKDIVQQQLCSGRIVTVLERSARFHICCAERLFDAERRVFDDKINAENLVNCLQMLFNMYDDLAALGVRCPNESEFRVYMMLLLLNSGEVPDLLVRGDEAAVAEASRLYFAYRLNLYAEFFKLAKRTTYLNACILQRYFGRVRTHILNVFVSAYSSGSQMARFPVAWVRRALEFDGDDETVAFVEAHGLAVHYNEADGVASEIRCSKASFHVPDLLPVCRSSYIVRGKRMPMLEAITGQPNFVADSRLTKVHSSFDERDVLKADALWALDQRQKVIDVYGSVYEHESDDRSSSSAYGASATAISGFSSEGDRDDIDVDEVGDVQGDDHVEGIGGRGAGVEVDDVVDYGKDAEPMNVESPYERDVRPSFASPKFTGALRPSASASAATFSFANIRPPAISSSTFNFGKIPFQQTPFSMRETTTTTTATILAPPTTTMTAISHFRFDALPAVTTMASSSSSLSSATSLPKNEIYSSAAVPSSHRDTTAMFVEENVPRMYDPEEEYESSDPEQSAPLEIATAPSIDVQQQLLLQQQQGESAANKMRRRTPTPVVIESVPSETMFSDAAAATAVPPPSSPAKHSTTPTSPSVGGCVIRRSDEIFDRLAHALNTFQSLYYNAPASRFTAVGATNNEETAAGGGGRATTTTTTRKLRKLVKRRLKLSHAKKYARLWRKKTQLRQRKRDNFVGVVHLAADEYFRLWGAVGSGRHWAARNLVAEMLDREKALRWSAALFRKGVDDGDGNASRSPATVVFAGDALADAITRVPAVQSRAIVCWKLLVSLPPCSNDNQRAFAAKIRNLISRLYCSRPDADADVTNAAATTITAETIPDGGCDSLTGNVWSTRVRGVRVCLAADVRSEAVVPPDAITGVTCVLLFACAKWEKWDELEERTLSVCRGAAYPPYVGAVVIGGDDGGGGSATDGNSGVASLESRLSALLGKLRQRNCVAGCTTAVWKRWTTVAEIVADSCRRAPTSPPFRACSLIAFVERVGTDLFASLQCADARAATNLAESPIPFIGAYNECLRAAAHIVCMRQARDFNLTAEMAEAAVAASAAAAAGSSAACFKTNFTHRELIAAAVEQFALVGFTKWPPKSTRKMETLLGEYCRRLDASNALLANVLRLMEVGDEDTVQTISGRAPWLQIVELWFRYRLQSVPSEKYENLYVIYGETELNQLIERLAIETVC